MTQRENKRLSKIEELYKGKIKNINDLTGGREPSKLFYILARHLDYLLDTDPNVCIKKYGVNPDYIYKDVKTLLEDLKK